MLDNKVLYYYYQRLLAIPILIDRIQLDCWHCFQMYALTTIKSHIQLFHDLYGSYYSYTKNHNIISHFRVTKILL